MAVVVRTQSADDKCDCSILSLLSSIFCSLAIADIDWFSDWCCCYTDMCPKQFYRTALTVTRRYGEALAVHSGSAREDRKVPPEIELHHTLLPKPALIITVAAPHLLTCLELLNQRHWPNNCNESGRCSLTTVDTRWDSASVPITETTLSVTSCGSVNRRYYCKICTAVVVLHNEYWLSRCLFAFLACPSLSPQALSDSV